VDLLTLRQAEKAADAYERPLAALFLPEPPREIPQEAQFRTLPDAPRPPWPPEMILLARRVRRRQDAAADLYDELDETPPWTESARRFSHAATVDPDELAREARTALGVTRGDQTLWASTDPFRTLRGWADAIEALGVLVMQDGSMPLELMRGFASLHDVVPAIVVNNADDPRARAFTVLHELAHLARAAAGTTATERWTNDFAGELILPREWLEQELRERPGRRLLFTVEAIARKYGTTPLATATRIKRTGLATDNEAEAVISHIRERGVLPKREGGGDYYYGTISRLGPGYIRLIFEALDSGVVTYPTASTLLDNVRVNNFDTLREYVGRRG